jgi:hypothetical protein
MFEDSLVRQDETANYTVEAVVTDTFTGVLRTYKIGVFDVCSFEKGNQFSIFEDSIHSRDEALEVLERQIRQYRKELLAKVAALDEILVGPCVGKSLLERVSEEELA